MRLCPVDLAACSRTECAGGYCVLEGEAHVTICWECGDIVDRRGHTAGTCIACLTVSRAAANEEA